MQEKYRKHMTWWLDEFALAAKSTIMSNCFQSLTLVLPSSL